MNDTYNVSYSTQGLVNMVSKYQVHKFYGLRVNEVWRTGWKWWITHSMNDNGFCRTAPATPEMVNILVFQSWAKSIGVKGFLLSNHPIWDHLLLNDKKANKLVLSYFPDLWRITKGPMLLTKSKLHF